MRRREGAGDREEDEGWWLGDGIGLVIKRRMRVVDEERGLGW